MENSKKIRMLIEDYEKAQRVIDDLNFQRNQDEKFYEYLLDGNILTLLWLRLTGRLKKSKMPYGSWKFQNTSAFGNNINYTDTLALYDYKIAVYTCIIGDYDQPQEPLFKPSNVDYILVTDSPLPSTGAWKVMDVRTIKGVPDLDNYRVSRYVKLHPHLFLDNYDYSIYIDGNIKSVGDMRYLIHCFNKHGFVSNLHRYRDCIYEELEECVRLSLDNPQTMREQIESYRSAGMSQHYGLIETNMLVRNRHNPICIEIMERWWHEIVKHSRRDQLSLPFVLWKMGIPVSDIGRISNNVYKIPLIRIQPHFKKRLYLD